MEHQPTAERAPESHYSLDTHVDAGITNPDGAVARIPHVLADLVWTLDRMLVQAVLDLLQWSFQLDLLSGQSGALAPVGDAITSLYTDTVGRQFLTAAVVAAGIWAMFHALVRRDYATATGRLALSAVLIVAALFVVRAPEQTIGAVASWSNDFSLAALSGLSAGERAGPEAVAESLHEQFVHQPWLVLNFGGLEVCTDQEANRVEPDDPRRVVCRPTGEPNTAGRGGYGARFLRWRPGSPERDAEYRALAEGRTDVGEQVIPGVDVGPIDLTPGIGPRDTPAHLEDLVVDEHDAAAVVIQQRGAGSERFVMSLLILAGTLGAVLLIGLLALAIILAQVVALLIAAFAPVALVAGAIPGRGHALFFEWAKGLIGALIAKAVLSLVLVVVLTVGAAVSGAVGELGFVMAFGLTSAFYWIAFMARRRVFGALQTVAAVSGVSTIAMPGMRRAGRVRVSGGGRPRSGPAWRRRRRYDRKEKDGPDDSTDDQQEDRRHTGPPQVKRRRPRSQSAQPHVAGTFSQTTDSPGARPVVSGATGARDQRSDPPAVGAVRATTTHTTSRRESATPDSVGDESGKQAPQRKKDGAAPDADAGSGSRGGRPANRPSVNGPASAPPSVDRRMSRSPWNFAVAVR